MTQAGILIALRCSTKHKHSHVHLHLEFSLLDIYNLTLPCQDEALVDSIRLTDVLILYVVENIITKSCHKCNKYLKAVVSYNPNTVYNLVTTVPRYACEY